jgi:hypothetical protein
MEPLVERSIIERRLDKQGFTMRVSRADAIAIANRGGDYPVHAAKPLDSPWVLTACGRRMACVNTHPADVTSADCTNCLQRRRR